MKQRDIEQLARRFNLDVDLVRLAIDEDPDFVAKRIEADKFREQTRIAWEQAFEAFTKVVNDHFGVEFKSFEEIDFLQLPEAKIPDFVTSQPENNRRQEIAREFLQNMKRARLPVAIKENTLKQVLLKSSVERTRDEVFIMLCQTIGSQSATTWVREQIRNKLLDMNLRRINELARSII